MANPQSKLHFGSAGGCVGLPAFFTFQLSCLGCTQSTWCWLVQAWTAIPFLVSCFFIEYLCLLSHLADSSDVRYE